MLGEYKSVPCRGDCEDILSEVFPGQRMKGYQELEFLEKINGVFIYFVGTAMRHCLKL